MRRHRIKIITAKVETTEETENRIIILGEEEREIGRVPGETINRREKDGERGRERERQ